MRMKKVLAIMATVATVAATTMTAPAEARGLGPGLAFGLVAGALTAGAIAASGPYYYGPGYGYYGPRYYGLLRWFVSVLSAPLLLPQLLVTKKSPEHRSGLFACSPDFKA